MTDERENQTKEKKARYAMRKKPIVVVISPLALNAQEEKWLKEYGCTLGFQGNRCTITCPPGTTRTGVSPLKSDQQVNQYEIVFPNGTRITQRCPWKWRFFGLHFGESRTSDLVIERGKV